MDRNFALYIVVGLTLFVLIRRYNWLRAGRPVAKQEKMETVVQNVFDKGVLDAKQEILNTFYYGLEVEPPKTKTCTGLDEAKCNQFADGCSWIHGACQAKSLAKWSGWTVTQMAPTAAFGGQFLEVEQIDGEGAPVLWRVGNRVRWEGIDPLGKSGVDGDYKITKIEQIGENRRLWLDTKNSLNYYWNKPELQIVAM